MKIAFVATHAIQYHVPWYRSLASKKGLDVKVYYACRPDAQQQGVGFGHSFEWNIPMYEGYNWQLLENKRERSSLDGFFSSSVANMTDVFRRDRPDIVVLTGWQGLPLLQALWSCIRLGIPRVVRGDSSGLKPRSVPIRSIHKMLLPRYDAFLVVGKANCKFYKDYGIHPSKLFPCPHFVDNDRLIRQVRSHRGERSNLRAQWKIAEDSICYLYVGKLTEKKNILGQLAALKAAVLRNSKLHLLVVGTGDLMDAAKQFSDLYKLPVTFAGFLNQSEIASAYVVADCLILASSDETWGLVVNEAMVCGLPAIVSDRVGCGPDLIKSGKTGELFAFGETEALSRLMLSMAESRDRLEVMGECAKALVMDQYSVERAVDGTLQAVDSVLQSSRAD